MSGQRKIKVNRIPDNTVQKLEEVEQKLGFIPNLFSVIAESNAGINAFVELNEQFACTSFLPTERELIQVVVSVENECAYCVAGHTKFAEIQEVSDELIQSVRNNQVLADEKLQRLNQFTRHLVNHKGPVDPKEINDFLKAGYSSEQVIEVILGISLKTFSNLTNNLFDIPLDDVFKNYSWCPEQNNQTIISQGEKT